ncbi:MAG: TlpA disulfide reductase family protein [Bacteroidota bacterium]
MKLTYFFSLLTMSVLLWNCNTTTTGVTLTGNLKNGNGLDVFLDRATIGGANEVLTKSPIANNGDFALAFPEGLDPGIYQIRIGAQRAAIALDGNDGEVIINGDVNTFGRYQFTLEGSKAGEEMANIMRGLAANRPTVERIQEIVKTAENPAVASYVAFQTLARAGAAGLDIHKEALAKLPATDPMHANYARYVSSLEAQIAQRRASEKIQVGQPAPNIELPSPDGTTYSLADLKGKVVLLDFWASWCGPCRRENPNVVKVYNKYKDDGFTIFSVSLDGVDPRRAGGLTAEQLAQRNEGQKKRWVDAITKDGLVWPYHVSELKKWSGVYSAEYGVTGIPKTFLIDRDGKIAAVGLRGAGQIEQALKQVL